MNHSPGIIVTMPITDQKQAIMAAVEHIGGVQPGTRCSAVLFDDERLRRERDFHERLYDRSGIEDADQRKAMLRDNVPTQPYWLVSLKSGNSDADERTQLHLIDVATGEVLFDRKKPRLDEAARISSELSCKDQ